MSSPPRWGWEELRSREIKLQAFVWKKKWGRWRPQALPWDKALCKALSPRELGCSCPTFSVFHLVPLFLVRSFLMIPSPLTFNNPQNSWGCYRAETSCSGKQAQTPQIRLEQRKIWGRGRRHKGQKKIVFLICLCQRLPAPGIGLVWRNNSKTAMSGHWVPAIPCSQPVKCSPWGCQTVSRGQASLIWNMETWDQPRQMRNKATASLKSRRLRSLSEVRSV